MEISLERHLGHIVNIQLRAMSSSRRHSGKEEEYEKEKETALAYQAFLSSFDSEPRDLEESKRKLKENQEQISRKSLSRMEASAKMNSFLEELKQ